MRYTGINHLTKQLKPAALTVLTMLAVLGLLTVLLDVWSIDWWLLTNRWWLYLLLTPLLLLGLHYFFPQQTKGAEELKELKALKEFPTFPRFPHFLISLIPPLWAGLWGGLGGVFGFKALQLIAASVANPPEFDFQLYWLFGRAGTLGLNPYLPQNLHQLAQPLNLSRELLAELYFFHPPLTLLLFTPLGWFDLHTAALLWYLSLGLALIADIILLWKTFPTYPTPNPQLQSPNLPTSQSPSAPTPNSQPSNLLTFQPSNSPTPNSLLPLALITLLILWLPATFSTLSFGQVNFLLLLFLLLFWRDHTRKRGGLWLALGLLVKPVLIILPLYLLLRRQWPALMGLAASLAALTLLTLLAFGPAMLFGYFVSNPITHNMPDYLYTETINQSLLATILRLTNYDLNQHGPLTHPLFLTLALLLTGTTAWLVYNLPNSPTPHLQSPNLPISQSPSPPTPNSQPSNLLTFQPSNSYGLALTLVLGLLLFPKTLAHYTVLLIIPIILLWQNRLQLGSVKVTLLITLTYVLTSYRSGDFAFYAILLCWTALAGISLHQIIRQPSDRKLPLILQRFRAIPEVSDEKTK